MKLRATFKALQAATLTSLLFGSGLALLLSVSSPASGQDSSPKGELPPVTAPHATVQPLPFSHKRHTEQQLPCKFCHANPEPGNEMAFPDTATCMACHESVAKDKPAIKKLAQYAKEQQPIPWVRVYVVPGFVYWSHRTHLDANLKCTECHGEVETMEAVVPVGKVTTMGGCVDCHRRKEASTGCATCHDSRSS